MIKRSNGRRQKCWSVQIPFYVWDRWKTAKKRKQDRKVKWKDSGCIRLTKKQWESMEKQLNSSGQFSPGYRDWLFFKRSKKTWRERTFNPKSSRTGSSSCQCSMTLYGTQMMRIVFQCAKSQESRIEMLSWTLDILGSRLRRKVVWGNTNHDQKGNLIAQPTRWYSSWKRLVILYSKVSAHWVVESWSKRMEELSFTSTQVQWTQNSCSKQFTL